MPDLLAKLLGRGIYTVPEAARLIHIPAPRLRRWFMGYDFDHAGERRTSPLVIRSELPIMGGATALSFLDLQEARCVAEFRARRVGWPALRIAHRKACEVLHTDHPFSTGQFKTFGREIMWESAQAEGDARLIAIAKNQLSFDHFLQPYLRALEFLRDHPIRWFPLEGSTRVVIDPARSFGAPIVTPRGVPTDILAKAVRAEGSVALAAEWFAVDVLSVEDAVRYEAKLAA